MRTRRRWPDAAAQARALDSRVARAFPFLIAAAIVALDQLSKAYVVANVPYGVRSGTWFGLIHLTHTRNTGAAFGLFRDVRIEIGALAIDGVQLLGIVSVAAAVTIAVWLLRARALPIGLRVALGVVMGGAIGNGVDRWRLGYVVDFIHAQRGSFDFAVFNVADAAITVGAVGLFLATLRSREASPVSDGR
jgi:signal peptidase II